MNVLKIPYKGLYFVAFILWASSGLNIILIGISCFNWVDIIGELFVFIISVIFFNFLIFPKVVRVNIDYIKGNSYGRQFLWKCMKVKSWIIMLFMMSLGFSIRKFSSLPPYVISGFYLGLGLSLVLSSLKYFKELLFSK